MTTTLAGQNRAREVEHAIKLAREFSQEQARAGGNFDLAEAIAILIDTVQAPTQTPEHTCDSLTCGHKIELADAIAVARGLATSHLTNYRWCLALEKVANAAERLQERDRQLTKFAGSLLDRLQASGESPRVIADWRAAMERFGQQ